MEARILARKLRRISGLGSKAARGRGRIEVNTMESGFYALDGGFLWLLSSDRHFGCGKWFGGWYDKPLALKDDYKIARSSTLYRDHLPLLSFFISQTNE